MNAVRWDNIPEDNLIGGIKRRIVTGERAMLGRLFFPKGAKVPAHTHESEQIVNVLKGSLKFVILGKDIIVQAGETLVIPSNIEHSAEALEETDEIDTFSPIRTDWLDGSDIYLRAQSTS
ncbi:MAG: cupin domain-containing protein [Chloroflexota bacterium]|nr:cupin domain-containing protein [Chloroflexota bacterium]